MVAWRVARWVVPWAVWKAHQKVVSMVETRVGSMADTTAEKSADSWVVRKAAAKADRMVVTMVAKKADWMASSWADCLVE